MSVTTTAGSFDEKNEPAKRAEERVRDVLIAAGYKAQLDNSDSRGDLVAKVNRVQIVEVKDEGNKTSTGNIAIETYQHDRITNVKTPSGFSSTESGVWVHVLGDMVALYRTAPMRYFLECTPKIFPERPFGKSDHGNGGRLIPIRDLTQFEWFDHTSIDKLPASPVFRFSFRASEAGKLVRQMLEFAANKGWDAAGRGELAYA
jgi:hypothetical protein